MTEQPHQRLKAERAGDILVLTILETHVEGDTIAEELREAMLGALGDARHAVIDLAHIQYISSVAFRPFLSLRRSLLERGGRLVVCGLNPVVGDIFFTTRMIDPEGHPAQIFDMQPGVQEALDHLQKLPAQPKEQA